MQFHNEDEKTETLGSITMKTFEKYAIGETPRDTHSKFPISYIPKILGFMLKEMHEKRTIHRRFLGTSHRGTHDLKRENVTGPAHLTHSLECWIPL